MHSTRICKGRVDFTEKNLSGFDALLTAATALLYGDKPSLFNIEVRIFHYLPFMEARRAQRFTHGMFGGTQ